MIQKGKKTICPDVWIHRSSWLLCFWPKGFCVV